MRSGLFLKTCVVLAATVGALAVAEAVVRLATIYPNTLAANRVADENVGFRASRNIPGIDSAGYRNPPNQKRQFIAVGDSQTFGLNVRSEESWPSRLSALTGKPIYNFGMGGYGLLAYHAVLNLDRDPSTKTAIVALYPVNDFELFYASDADCLILENPSRFWKEEQRRLALQWPAYPVGCLHNDYDMQTGLYDWLMQHVALAGLIDGVATKIATYLGGETRAKFPIWSGQGEMLAFPDSRDVISLSRIEGHGRSVDLSVPEVAAMWNNLPRLLRSWRDLSNEGLSVGVVVIPSRERIIFEYYSRQNRLNELDPRFVAGVQKQVALEAEIRKVLDGSGLAFVFALEDTFQAYSYGIKNNILTYPPYEEGHPTGFGYTAYAGAAKRLFAKMGIQ